MSSAVPLSSADPRPQCPAQSQCATLPLSGLTRTKFAQLKAELGELPDTIIVDFAVSAGLEKVLAMKDELTTMEQSRVRPARRAPVVPSPPLAPSLPPLGAIQSLNAQLSDTETQPPSLWRGQPPALSTTAPGEEEGLSTISSLRRTVRPSTTTVQPAEYASEPQPRNVRPEWSVEPASSTPLTAGAGAVSHSGSLPTRPFRTAQTPGRVSQLDTTPTWSSLYSTAPLHALELLTASTNTGVPQQKRSRLETGSQLVLGEELEEGVSGVSEDIKLEATEQHSSSLASTPVYGVRYVPPVSPAVWTMPSFSCGLSARRVNNWTDYLEFPSLELACHHMATKERLMTRDGLKRSPGGEKRFYSCKFFRRRRQGMVYRECNRHFNLTIRYDTPVVKLSWNNVEHSNHEGVTGRRGLGDEVRSQLSTWDGADGYHVSNMK